MEIICLFGDSTEWGAWDLEKGGWVTRLWLAVSKDAPDVPLLYNCAVSGGRSDTLLARFESETKAREGDAIVFQTGANDAYIRGTGPDNRVPFDQFEHNIRELISRGRTITPDIIFVGPTNVDETKTTPVSWEDISYYNKEIKRYNEALRAICADEQVPFVDVYGILTTDDLADGLHPNAVGHEKIFMAVYRALQHAGWVEKTQ